jgi:hypothetical protein
MMHMDPLQPGHGVIFLQVGTHANESLERIIERKRLELDQTQRVFWGYGSSLCHPLQHVKPFVKSHRSKGQDVYVVMHERPSEYYGEPNQAAEYSEDGINWQPMPAGNRVLGSRYALVFDSFDPVKQPLDLTQTKVAEGTMRGLLGSEYLRGRVDKACLDIIPPAPNPDHAPVFREIRLLARLAEPYAVFLR